MVTEKGFECIFAPTFVPLYRNKSQNQPKIAWPSWHSLISSVSFMAERELRPFCPFPRWCRKKKYTSSTVCFCEAKRVDACVWHRIQQQTTGTCLWLHTLIWPLYTYTKEGCIMRNVCITVGNLFVLFSVCTHFFLFL